MVEDFNVQREAMQRAIALALENVKSAGGGPFGAVIVRQGKVIAEGVNLVTSSNDPTAHAEVVAIRRACQFVRNFELRDCELYASCEPCPMCLGAIYWARLGRLYFAASRADAAGIGFDDSRIYDELALPLELRKIPTSVLMREEALMAFEHWRDSTSKVPY
jgi:guanine deaminase